MKKYINNNLITIKINKQKQNLYQLAYFCGIQLQLKTHEELRSTDCCSYSQRSNQEHLRRIMVHLTYLWRETLISFSFNHCRRFVFWTGSEHTDAWTRLNAVTDSIVVKNVLQSFYS